MQRDEIPVFVRTSTSARDFWCRERSEGFKKGDVNPFDGRVMDGEDSFIEQIRRDLPYGRQRTPSGMPPSPAAVLPSSSSVVRYETGVHPCANGIGHTGGSRSGGRGGGTPTRFPPLRKSRSVERQIFRAELQDVENRLPLNTRLEQKCVPLVCNCDLVAENARLKRDVEVLHLHYERALRINHVLTGQMLHEARPLPR